MNRYFVERAMDRRRRAVELELRSQLWWIRASTTCVAHAGFFLAIDAIMGCFLGASGNSIGWSRFEREAVVLECGALGLALALLLQLASGTLDARSRYLVDEMRLAPAILNDLRAWPNNPG